MRKAPLICLAALLATSCLSLNNKELPRTRPEVVEYSPVVLSILPAELTKTHNGRATDLAAMGQGALAQHEPRSIARAWASRNFVKEWGAPGELEFRATHRLTLKGSVDENSSIFAAVLTGVTLYVIPSSATVTHDFEATLERVSDGAVFTARAKNSHTIWQWIGFAPLTPLLSVAWGGVGAENDRAFYLYQQFVEQGAFGDPTRAASK